MSRVEGLSSCGNEVQKKSDIGYEIVLWNASVWAHSFYHLFAIFGFILN